MAILSSQPYSLRGTHRRGAEPTPMSSQDLECIKGHLAKELFLGTGGFVLTDVLVDNAFRKIQQVQHDLERRFQEDRELKLSMLELGTKARSVYITPNIIMIKKEKLGEGTYSTVSAVMVIAMRTIVIGKEVLSPNYPKTMALKTLVSSSGHSLIAEKTLLDQSVTPEHPSIDFFLKAWNDVHRLDTSYSLHNKYDTDFASVRYVHKVSNSVCINLPGGFLTQMALAIFKGMSDLQAHGMIHGDLKGNNLLLKQSTLLTRSFVGEFQFAITDFNFLRRQSDRIETVRSVPLYRDPTMFQTGEEPSILVNQKNEKGQRTFSSDNYALARTIEIDGIMRFLFEAVSISKSYDTFCKETKDLQPERLYFPGALEEQDLRELDRQYPYRAHYIDAHHIDVYQPLEKRKEAMHRQIAILKTAQFSEKEIDALYSLADLIYDLQRTSIEERPDTEEVLRELKEIQDTYATPVAVRLKRGRGSEEYVEMPDGKKMRYHSAFA